LLGNGPFPGSHSVQSMGMRVLAYSPSKEADDSSAFGNEVHLGSITTEVMMPGDGSMVTCTLGHDAVLVSSRYCPPFSAGGVENYENPHKNM
jgi:hypothetical protein